MAFARVSLSLRALTICSARAVSVRAKRRRSFFVVSFSSTLERVSREAVKESVVSWKVYSAYMIDTMLARHCRVLRFSCSQRCFG